jgi:hypothetical protein
MMMKTDIWQFYYTSVGFSFTLVLRPTLNKGLRKSADTTLLKIHIKEKRCEYKLQGSIKYTSCYHLALYLMSD